MSEGDGTRQGKVKVYIGPKFLILLEVNLVSISLRDYESMSYPPVWDASPLLGYPQH